MGGEDRERERESTSINTHVRAWVIRARVVSTGSFKIWKTVSHMVVLPLKEERSNDIKLMKNI